jgi:RNA recognition motif-containing protein
MKGDKESRNTSPVQTYKIYVGNLPASARTSELKELFEKYGNVVECDILKDFGFIHMDNSSDAKASIAGLNDTLWKGGRLRVEMSTTNTNKGEPSMRRRMVDERGRRFPPSYQRMPPMMYRDDGRSGRDYHMLPNDRFNGHRDRRYGHGPPPPPMGRYGHGRSPPPPINDLPPYDLAYEIRGSPPRGRGYRNEIPMYRGDGYGYQAPPDPYYRDNMIHPPRYSIHFKLF